MKLIIATASLMSRRERRMATPLEYGSIVWDTLQATDLMFDHHVLKYVSQMLLANEVADKFNTLISN